MEIGRRTSKRISSHRADSENTISDPEKKAQSIHLTCDKSAAVLKTTYSLPPATVALGHALPWNAPPELSKRKSPADDHLYLPSDFIVCSNVQTLSHKSCFVPQELEGCQNKPFPGRETDRPTVADHRHKTMVPYSFALTLWIACS